MHRPQPVGDRHLSHGHPVGQISRPLQMRDQAQGGNSKVGQVRHLHLGDHPSAQDDLVTQIVVDTVHPDIVNLVGDDVFDVEQAQNPRWRYLFQTLPQSAIGRRLGQEQALQLDVALEGEHPAIVAIHAGDSINEGQVGGQDFLQLGGHHVVIDGLRRQLIPENLLYLPQIARVKSQA